MECIQVVASADMHVADENLRNRVTPTARHHLLAQPGVTSIVFGASRVEHLDDVARAVALRLTPAAARELDLVFPPRQRACWLRWVRRLLRG